MAEHFKFMPRYLTGKIKSNVMNKAKNKVGVDLNRVDLVKYVMRCNIPALFIHGSKDTIVRQHHGKILYYLYKGPKKFLDIDQDHNSPRDDNTWDDVVKFLNDIFT